VYWIQPEISAYKSRGLFLDTPSGQEKPCTQFLIVYHKNSNAALIPLAIWSVLYYLGFYCI